MSGIVEKAQESRTVNTKTRITAFIRDAMIAKAMDTSGINARKKQLIDDRAALAEDVRQFALRQSGLTDEGIRGIQEKLEKEYPSGGHARDFLKVDISFQTHQRFNVNLNGMDVYLWLDGRPFEYHAYDEGNNTHLTKGIQDRQKEDTTAIFVPRQRANIASVELGDRFIKLDAEKELIASKVEQITNTLRATIKKFGTVETMLEAWPEAEELLPKELRPSTALAISPDDLNAICGIPTGKAE